MKHAKRAETKPKRRRAPAPSGVPRRRKADTRVASLVHEVWESDRRHAGVDLLNARGVLLLPSDSQ